MVFRVHMVYVLGARTIFIVAVAGEAFAKNHNLSGFRQFGPRVSGHNRHEIHTCESSSVTLREKSTTDTKNHKIQNSSMAADISWNSHMWKNSTKWANHIQNGMANRFFCQNHSVSVYIIFVISSNISVNIWICLLCLVFVFTLFLHIALSFSLMVCMWRRNLEVAVCKVWLTRFHHEMPWNKIKHISNLVGKHIPSTKIFGEEKNMDFQHCKKTLRQIYITNCATWISHSPGTKFLFVPGSV